MNYCKEKGCDCPNATELGYCLLTACFRAHLVGEKNVKFEEPLAERNPSAMCELCKYKELSDNEYPCIECSERRSSKFEMIEVKREE